VPRAKVISRADVAYAMFAMLDDPSAITQAVGVSG
jgi:hypothetical protein